MQDNLYSDLKLKQEMARLVNKWKDKKPAKDTNDWWRYRADRSYYLALKSKLK